MRLRISHIVILFLTCSFLYGQQEAQYTQYLDNMQYYNPAYAGSRDMMNVTAIHRQQWVGIDGAPMSSTLSLNTPLKYESLGLGIGLLNDRIGPLNQTWVNVDVSYTLRFKRHSGKLAMGLKGGINLVNNSLSSLYAIDDGDYYASQNIVNDILPNLGAGLYYHSDKFFAGLSVPRIVESLSAPTEVHFEDQRHYYATIGGYFTANRMLKVRPSMMLKVTENAPFALDGSLAFIFYDKFWLGGNYRLMESAGAFFQYQFSHNFKVGYAFDISTTSLMRHNFGTHELLISYDFLYKKKSIHTPRYF